MKWVCNVYVLWDSLRYSIIVYKKSNDNNRQNKKYNNIGNESNCTIMATRNYVNWYNSGCRWYKTTEIKFFATQLIPNNIFLITKHLKYNLNYPKQL